MKGISGILVIVIILSAIILGVFLKTTTNIIINQTFNTSGNGTGVSVTTLPMGNITDRDFGILISQANITGITIPSTNVTNWLYTTSLPIHNITGLTSANCSGGQVAQNVTLSNGVITTQCTTVASGGTSSKQVGIYWIKGIVDINTNSLTPVNFTLGSPSVNGIKINETADTTIEVSFTANGYAETETIFHLKRDGVFLSKSHSPTLTTNFYTIAMNSIVNGTSGEHTYYVEWYIASGSMTSYNRPNTQNEHRELIVKTYS